MILASFAVKKNIISILLTNNGRKISQMTYKLDATDIENVHTVWFEAYKTVLRHLKQYVDEHMGEEDAHSVLFECPNSTFIGWCKQGYSRPEYRLSFAKCLEALDDVPVSYSYTVNKNALAIQYLKEKYLPKVQLSSANNILDMFGEES